VPFWIVGREVTALINLDGRRPNVLARAIVSAFDDALAFDGHRLLVVDLVVNDGTLDLVAVKIGRRGRAGYETSVARTLIRLFMAALR